MAEFYMKDIRAWRDATLMLSFEERGYFDALLSLIYRYDDCLPDDDELICQAMPVGKRLHKRLKEKLLKARVIEMKDGFYFNKRATIELLKINSKSTINKENAEKRWAKSRKTNNKDDANALQTDMPIVKVNGKSKKKEDPNVSISPQDVVDLWNKECPSLGKVIKITHNRRQKITKRVKEDLNTEDDWQKYFVAYERSNFLSGRAGNWKATFDWALQPANMVKVLEGNYTNDGNGFDPVEYNRRKQEEEMKDG